MRVFHVRGLVAGRGEKALDAPFEATGKKLGIASSSVNAPARRIPSPRPFHSENDVTEAPCKCRGALIVPALDMTGSLIAAVFTRQRRRRRQFFSIVRRGDRLFSMRLPFAFCPSTARLDVTFKRATMSA